VLDEYSTALKPKSMQFADKMSGKCQYCLILRTRQAV